MACYLKIVREILGIIYWAIRIWLLISSMSLPIASPQMPLDARRPECVPTVQASLLLGPLPPPVSEQRV